MAYIVSITRQKENQPLGERTVKDVDQVISTGVAIYQKARHLPGRLSAHNQYFPTDSGFPVGTHHLSIGRRHENGLNVLETVIMRVSEDG